MHATVYPSLSTTVIRTFDCNDFDDGSSWLEIDYSLDCHSVTHTWMKAYAALMALLWIVGCPCLYMCVRSPMLPLLLCPVVVTPVHL